MRKSIKKLTLNRETIGGMEGDGLREAAGGITLSCGITVCCTFKGCGSANSQCNTVCIPCQTATGCIQTYTC